jgi:hypothetical protein
MLPLYGLREETDKDMRLFYMIAAEKQGQEISWQRIKWSHNAGAVIHGSRILLGDSV